MRRRNWSIPARRESSPILTLPLEESERRVGVVDGEHGVNVAAERRAHPACIPRVDGRRDVVDVECVGGIALPAGPEHSAIASAASTASTMIVFRIMSLFAALFRESCGTYGCVLPVESDTVWPRTVNADHDQTTDDGQVRKETLHLPSIHGPWNTSVTGRGTQPERAPPTALPSGDERQRPQHFDEDRQHRENRGDGSPALSM